MGVGLSDDLGLNWAILALSLFNAVILAWLGGTVLLNTERRNGGIWLAVVGLLSGSLFFLCHTALLGQGLDPLDPGADLWWHLGWAPVVALPAAWYIVMLWYGGYWNQDQTSSSQAIYYKLHTPVLLIVCLAAAGIGILLVFANPLPSFYQAVQLNFKPTPSLAGTPILVLIYPVYLLFCSGAALAALSRPARAEQSLGHLARRRARQWLLAATVSLLFVGLLVGLVMFWLTTAPHPGTFDASLRQVIAWFDLVISGLVGVSSVLIGQAITSYEIFTGRSLPRHGLARFWRRAVILAGGFGAVNGLSLALKLPPVYSLLLSTLLIAAFYTLLSWRSLTERSRLIAQLRPFAASQQLYQQLTEPGAIPDSSGGSPAFNALCEEVLDARRACLAALGALSPLFGPPWVYPPGDRRLLAGLEGFVPRLSQTEQLYLALQVDPGSPELWAVPLRNDLGLVGVLLLEEKKGGQPYTQEEIEIARLVGERLLDSQASAEMARRLMGLQRRHLAFGQVMDQRARRILHDEILPQVHAVMLLLSQEDLDPGQRVINAVEALSGIHRQTASLLREMPAVSTPQVARLGLIEAFRQAVEEEYAQAFDSLAWQVESGADEQARAIPALIAEVIYYAGREVVRNAARHGRDRRSEAPFHLQIKIDWRNGLEIEIIDDGVGIGSREGKPELPDRSGQGLALHTTLMAVVGGILSVDSTPGRNTRVLIWLPQSAW